MHALFEHLKSFYLGMVALGVSIGVTVKACGWILKRLREFRERRLDDKMLNFICAEWLDRSKNTQPDNYGQRKNRLSTFEISDAFKKSAVAMRRRLLRLEDEGRVHQAAPHSDTWYPTNQELHDNYGKKQAAASPERRVK